MTACSQSPSGPARNFHEIELSILDVRVAPYWGQQDDPEGNPVDVRRGFQIEALVDGRHVYALQGTFQSEDDAQARVKQLFSPTAGGREGRVTEFAADSPAEALDDQFAYVGSCR